MSDTPSPTEPPRERGLRIGSFAGAPIVVDPTILLLAAYIVGTSVLDGGPGALDAALAFLFALVVAVLLHEFGHAGVASLLHLPSKRIVLTFFGGHVEFVREPEKRWQEILVSAAGPLTNLACAALMLVAIPFLSEEGVFEGSPIALDAFALNFLYVSFLLGLFNLLPGFPLDGGRILTAVLSYFMVRPRAFLITAYVGLLIALGVIGWGALRQWWWTLFIGVILALAAWAEIQRAHAALDHSTRSNA